MELCFQSVADIDGARKKEHVVLQSILHTLNMKQNRHYAHVDCPGHADYKKYDYRCSTNGWCN
jgi:translation elongation factor EF-Tu-like GTPase